MKKWPEKMKVLENELGVRGVLDYCLGFNDALDACADSLPTVSELEEMIEHFTLVEWAMINDKHETNETILKRRKDFAQAISRRIRGES